MPREIVIHNEIQMELDKREVTQAVIETLKTDQGVSVELSEIVDENLVKLDSNGRTIGSYRRSG